jgi:fatty-acyl-CoA synthase
VRILNPEGRPVVGEAGELVITGPQRLTAYYGQPEKTAESLRDGWFYTGDIARLDEAGRLHVLGRKEDAISKGGRYVRPADIEDLVQAIPGVGEAGVVGSPAVAAEQKIILAVSPARGARLTEQDVRAGLAGKLPPEAQPDLIVVADELPHTQDGSGGRGKLLRRDIRTRYEALLAK